jgi:hypothetical protein
MCESCRGVWIHDLRFTHSAFHCLLKHTFLTPTAMVMAMLVQPCEELAVFCGNELTNGLKLFGTIMDCGKITSSLTCF